MARAQLFILALLSVHVLLGALCIAAARGERDARALAFWGWGLVVYAVGLALSLGGTPATGFAGNSLISLSAVITVQGALFYTTRRLHWPAAMAGLAATVAVLAGGNFGPLPSMAANFGAPTVFASIVFAFGAMTLLRHPVAHAVEPTRFVALVLLTAIVVWVVRLAALPPLLAEPVDRQRLDLVVSVFAIAQILVGVGAAFGLFWVEVRLVQAAMASMAFTDPLTALPNRRAIVMRFEEEAARATRNGTGFAMAVYDIDRFKEVNDTHGHLAGDALLCHVGRLLGTGKRTEDVLGRIGGEEFVVLMCGPQPGGAGAAAERLRERVAATPLLHEGLALAVTLSGGLAQFPEDGTDWDHLFAVADRRLYEAKRAGRNRVVGAAT